eukprot:3903890-Pleurochrysis_carterae.AAC.1
MPFLVLARLQAASTFGHTPSQAAAQLENLLQTESELKADLSKVGKGRFSRWRMAHAAMHGNAKPATRGQPMHDTDMDQHIIDALHLAKLGLPKTRWKVGIMNNSSDNARAAISEQLAASPWKHPLDCCHKDNNRVRENTWFTGERWSFFCSGERGSPGAPIAIAMLVVIIAKDLQARGVDAGSGEAAVAAEAGEMSTRVRAHGGRGRGGRGSRGGRGRSAFTIRAAAEEVDNDDENDVASRAHHVPTEVERCAEQKELSAIRD